jgi:thiamine biosynthesis protein ThiI
MRETKALLLKYGEIALKGLNRSNFEKLLEQNIKHALRKYKAASGNKNLCFNIQREQSVMTLRCGDPDFEIDAVIPVLSKIFGIAAVNPAVETEKDIEKIKEAAKKHIAPLLAGKKSFGVAAKRSDKSFPMKSPEIASIVGDALLEFTDSAGREIKVDLGNPEIKITVEIRSNGAFLHASDMSLGSAAKQSGAGGMPSGSSGTGLLLLSGGIDSPVAGYMMARRGMKISALHFTSPPYTSERAREKTVKLAKILSDYCGHIKFYEASLTEIQENIRKYCDEDYGIVLLRRFMLKIAESVAETERINCIITGESLGLFRPCIGLDKYQIIETAEKIGTYETSVEPYEDCCAIFTPRHPVTKPKLGKVLSEENRIADIAGLIERALGEIRII